MNMVNDATLKSIPVETYDTVSSVRSIFKASMDMLDQQLMSMNDQLVRCEAIADRVCGTDSQPQLEGNSNKLSGIVADVDSAQQKLLALWQRLQEVNARLEELFG